MTPTPGRPPTTGFTRTLPEDLVTDQLGRLALFSLIGVVLWTSGLLIDQLVILTVPPRIRGRRLEAARPRGGRRHRLQPRCSCTCGTRAHTAETKTDVSLVYMILNAAAIAALNTYVAPPPMQAR